MAKKSKIEKDKLKVKFEVKPKSKDTKINDLSKVEKKIPESKDQSKELMKVENKTLETKGIGSPSSNHNHPEWYAGNEILTKSLGKINFNNFRGIANDLEFQVIPVNNGRIDDVKMHNNNYDINISNKFPGIMTHDYTPVFGALNSVGNDAEEMSRMVYANMRRVISGQRGYDSNTVLQYLLSIGSFITAFSELHRVLAASHNRQTQNKYFGERLVEALGYDYDDLANNYNSYITQLNMLTATSQTFILPKGISLFERWRWLNSSVFMDGDDVKAPLVAFIPTGFWKFDVLDKTGTYGRNNINTVATQKGFRLSPTATTAEFGLTFINYQKFNTLELRKTRFQSIINELRKVSHLYMDNKDFNLIAADMLKTYGEDVHTLMPFDPQTLLNITYDPGLNIAAKNITYFPFTFKTIIETLDLNIDKVGRTKALSYVLSDESIKFGANYGILDGYSEGSSGDFYSLIYNPQKLYVYSHSDEVDPLQAMSLTKWITRYSITDKYADGNSIIMKDDGSGTEYGVNLLTCGTEVIHASTIYSINEQAYIDRFNDYIGNPDTTKYGLTQLIWGGSNVLPVSRNPKDILGDGTEARTSGLLNFTALQWAAWVGQWNSSPATYFMLHNDLYANLLSTGSSNEGKFDIMSLNPTRHYTVLDTESLKRHQEVALASMLGIGRWGTNSINSNRSTPGSDLNSTAFIAKS